MYVWLSAVVVDISLGGIKLWRLGGRLYRGTSLAQVGQCVNKACAHPKDTQDADTIAKDCDGNSDMEEIGICCDTSSIFLVGKRLGKASVRNMQACAGIIQKYGLVV